MVMLSIPFSLIDAFGLVFLSGTDFSMVGLMGVLTLVGTDCKYRVFSMSMV